MIVALRVARALLLTASTVVVTLAQLNLPSGFWAGHKEMQVASVIVLAVVVLVDTSNEVNYLLQAREIQDYDKDLRSVLSAAAGGMVDLGVPWDEATVRCYRRRSWLFGRRLGLVGGIKAGADVEEPRHLIRSGVGLVGTAFKDQEIVAEEWAEFVRQGKAEGRALWERRASQERFGMTWGHLQHQTSQPDGMVASPTFPASGRPNGCVLLSGPLKRPELESEGIRRILEDLATSLDRIGPPPRGWWRAHER
ncbi:hypothetical protein ACWF0M_14205 [Kribbella sp. NPDC055110]